MFYPYYRRRQWPTPIDRSSPSAGTEVGVIRKSRPPSRTSAIPDARQVGCTGVPTQSLSSSTVLRVRRRLEKTGILPHLLGLWLRRHFQRAGIIVVMGGFPLPEVHNLGRIEVDDCAFYSGVRIECWAGALIRIGNGTDLNRGA